MKLWVLLIIAALMACPSYGREQIRPFASDGCSSWPDGPPRRPDLWRECCFTHDLSYWMGGSRAQRRTADLRLKECVESRGENFQGMIMYWGVRVGGRPNYSTPFRWGYGWPEKRGYLPLTRSERTMVSEELSLFHGTVAEERWLKAFRELNRI